MSDSESLPRSFYLSESVVDIGRRLLGKFLFSRSADGVVTGGIIVETEAYAGPEDRASHAFNNRKTRRTDTMFRQGGVAYVYLCYGIHRMLNIVTNREGIPHAVLLRALEPTAGIEVILHRRNKEHADRSLAGGPGTLTQALDVTMKDDGVDLTGDRLWLEDRGVDVPSEKIASAPRIGVDYAGDYARMPWRFQISGTRWSQYPVNANISK
jgi:DNA-3-methyladenine glycosylase